MVYCKVFSFFVCGVLVFSLYFSVYVCYVSRVLGGLWFFGVCIFIFLFFVVVFLVFVIIIYFLVLGDVGRLSPS